MFHYIFCSTGYMELPTAKMKKYKKIAEKDALIDEVLLE